MELAKLREVAKALQSWPGTVAFPGWDFENVPTAHEEGRFHAIRNAAAAVLNTTDYDTSIRASHAEVGCLLEYIADMLS